MVTQPLKHGTSDMPNDIGKFSTVKLNQEVCEECLAGYYCPAGITITDMFAHAYSCAKGEYSGTGATKCTPCVSGYYCPLLEMTLDEMTQYHRCADNTWSDSGASACSTCSLSCMSGISYGPCTTEHDIVCVMPITTTVRITPTTTPAPTSSPSPTVIVSDIVTGKPQSVTSSTSTRTPANSIDIIGWMCIIWGLMYICTL